MAKKRNVRKDNEYAEGERPGKPPVDDEVAEGEQQKDDEAAEGERPGQPSVDDEAAEGEQQNDDEAAEGEEPGKPPVDDEAAEGEANIPGAEKLSPEQLDQIKRFGLAAQAILATPPHNAEIVQMASSGDSGIISASVAILSLINDRVRLTRETAPLAAVTVLMVLVDFLVATKRMKPDPNIVGRLIGRLLVRVASQYGISQKDVMQMVGQAQSSQRKAMNAQAARSGLVGKLMERL
jgi:hypothetical protein